MRACSSMSAADLAIADDTVVHGLTAASSPNHCRTVGGSWQPPLRLHAWTDCDRHPPNLRTAANPP
jgi:hypothetical protein